LKKYKVNYQNGDITSLPFKDEEFDVVSCVSVLEHMSKDDQLKSIKEMSRVVKKGGKLIITYDKKEDLTDLFIRESATIPIEIVNFSRTRNPLHRFEVIGMCLAK
jgi:ubiquinone/menaquinone biosynthesis C-methylase UbiE